MAEFNSIEHARFLDPRTNGMVQPLRSGLSTMIEPFSYNQGASAGADGDNVILRQLPAGRVLFMPKLSFIQWSAFGTSRVLDIGFKAYTAEDGTAVSASLAAFDDDVAIASAGSANMGSDIAAGTGGWYEFASRSGVVISALCTGGTIPANATLHGYLVYSIIGN